jgi:hypothetical protein
LIEVFDADQFVETVHAARGPGFVGFDDEGALGGFELHLENIRDDDFGCGFLTGSERQAEKSERNETVH